MEQSSSIINPGTVIGVGNTIGILFTSIYLYNKVNQINEDIVDIHNQMEKQIEIMTRLSNNNDLKDQFENYTRNVKKLTEINNDLVDRLSGLEELYHEEHNELREIKKFIKTLGYKENSKSYDFTQYSNRKTDDIQRHTQDDYDDYYKKMDNDQYDNSSKSNTRYEKHTNDRNVFSKNKNKRDNFKNDFLYEQDDDNKRRNENQKSIQRSLKIKDKVKEQKNKFKNKPEYSNLSDSEDDILSKIRELNS